MSTPAFNLLTEAWLPVQLENGGQTRLRLAEIGRADIRDIIAPRADFRGALYQLLIGLLQTAFAPEGRREWLEHWRQPPDAEQLEQVFQPFEAAFHLFAEDGQPAFMQDLHLPDGEEKPVSQLLIEAPGDQTLRNNQDHFIKRGGVDRLSPVWAAVALFTLQINAPSGGKGHRTSLRGGGPLTTLVLPPADTPQDTLWHRLWFNVLPSEEVADLPGDETLANAVFPWMGDTPTSEKKGSELYPGQAHPLQVFWGMPRRIRLHWRDEEAACDLGGQSARPVVSHYHTKNYGINYAGTWLHPLTPYVFEDGKEHYSLKAQPGGIGYRHWLGLVVEEKRGKQRRSPARIVDAYARRRQWLRNALDAEPRLWAFGYDMDNMKARCWYEAEMPLFNLDQDQREDVAEAAQKLVVAASDVLKTLKSALKSAWFDRPKDAKGDMSFVDANFWAATEAAFYRVLKDIIRYLDDEEACRASRQQWAGVLRNTAQALFDDYALSELNADGDIKRVMKARIGKGGLEHYLNGSKQLKSLVA